MMLKVVNHADRSVLVVRGRRRSKHAVHAAQKADLVAILQETAWMTRATRR